MNRTVDDDDETSGYIRQFQERFDLVEDSFWLDELGEELMPRLARIAAEEEAEEKRGEDIVMMEETGKDAEGVDTMESDQVKRRDLTAELNTYIVQLLELFTAGKIDEDEMERRVDEWQRDNNFLEVQEKPEAQVGDKEVTLRRSTRNKMPGGDESTREQGVKLNKEGVETVPTTTTTKETQVRKRGRPPKTAKATATKTVLGKRKDRDEDRELMPVSGKVSSIFVVYGN
jgi:hypothetical protein